MGEKDLSSERKERIVGVSHDEDWRQFSDRARRDEWNEIDFFFVPSPSTVLCHKFIKYLSEFFFKRNRQLTRQRLEFFRIVEFLIPSLRSTWDLRADIIVSLFGRTRGYMKRETRGYIRSTHVGPEST